MLDPKNRTPAGTSPIRRRRFLVVVLALVGFIYFFGSPFHLPGALKDVSRANIAQLVKPKPKAPTVPVDEMFGLIHLVTGDNEQEHILGHTESFDPTKPLDMALYAAGKKDVDWNERMQAINEQYPLVVFSKSYCPYSKRAKALLASYDLSPPPKIIEVDLRDDATQVKSVLTRLTRHGTFPNVVLRGKSLGGSDQLQALHADKSLRHMLEGAGIVIGDTVA
ncbi:thioredoxin-like protein [Mycena vitilis]|nr:thioredoxin-like protein [Mycena vitilis]